MQPITKKVLEDLTHQLYQLKTKFDQALIRGEAFYTLKEMHISIKKLQATIASAMNNLP
jgi:hypothetical protein